jgi:hypothetical protein
MRGASRYQPILRWGELMPTYTCLCCEHTETFESADAAFAAGWDVAPHFTLQPVCNLCLSAPILILGLDGARRRHAAAHARWQRDGRPRKFDAAAEFAADGLTPEQAAARKAELHALQKGFESRRN